MEEMYMYACGVYLEAHKKRMQKELLHFKANKYIAEKDYGICQVEFCPGSQQYCQEKSLLSYWLHCYKRQTYPLYQTVQNYGLIVNDTIAKLVLEISQNFTSKISIHLKLIL